MKYILTSLLLLLVHQTFPNPLSLLSERYLETGEHFLVRTLGQSQSADIEGLFLYFKRWTMKVAEYLDLSSRNNLLTYTATVVRQNGGKSVSFKQTKIGDELVFENPTHDFPKKLVYKRISIAK
ncbi:hypothetical protein [Chitinophaga pinensis]|uniref:Uncharacterized protein n=1 Tax=Chitinophaga pinensis TaxID=79329 RepID=A0A5C6LNI7_9BACT|nr:hypothetical protein [Chitinophaga pinensis]TWV90755.1 hypothetical protein FEF09_29270 [Chitinophaga pinensis]